MRIVTSVRAMQLLARRWQRAGLDISLVPTMGYLHAGHMSLVRRARVLAGKTGRVLVSIYVNPTQFGPKEDFKRYPRDLARDSSLCRKEGVDVIFAPKEGEMYPTDASGPHSTYVVEEQVSQGMEGASRPTHFRGVATVVAKLFNIVLPNHAVFGAKDFQQAALIKRMVRDLNFPLKIDVSPTIREPDGLAMSSRNKYLEGDLRRQAVVLKRSMDRVRESLRKSSTALPANRLKADVKKFVEQEPDARLDYVELFDAETLQPTAKVTRKAHMAVAVFVGTTRLIDNAKLG